MAFSDGDWDYDFQTLSDPSTASYTDGLFGYTNKTLTNPGTTEFISDSAWGTRTTTLNLPHNPVGVLTADGWHFVPILSWTGTAWVGG